MDESEYAEAVRYLLNSMEGSELRDWYGAVYEAGLDTTSAREQLVASLQSLRTQIVLAGDRVPREILRRANDIVGTTDGQPIDGLVVDLGEEDVRAFGVERFDLTEPRDDHRQVVAQVDELLAAIAEDV